MFSEVRKRAKKAGRPPGVAAYTGNKKHRPIITYTVYSPNDFHEIPNASLQDCFNEVKDDEIKWINVEGLSDIELMKELTRHFNVHPLTLEDILNIEQRPKVEEFETYMFVTIKVLLWQPKDNTFLTQQVSIILGENFILSFHELDTSLFDAIREKMRSSANQNIRKHGPDYLMYRMIDSIIDEYFVVMEGLSDEIEGVEEAIVANPNNAQAREIYELKRQILLLRKSVWPMREAISHLMHADNQLISKFTLIYIRDVYDHTVQAIDTLETFRDMLSGMLDMYLTSLTNRMNEIMKTLTIITTIFIPITAIASVYGMNFAHMPGTEWSWGYPLVLFIMIAIAGLMLVYFRKKKWI